MKYFCGRFLPASGEDSQPKTIKIIHGIMNLHIGKRKRCLPSLCPFSLLSIMNPTITLRVLKAVIPTPFSSTPPLN